MIKDYLSKTKRNQIQIFNNRQVRTVWDTDSEEWYFSVVDVIGVLTDSDNVKKLVIIYFVATFVPVLVVCLLSNQICNFYGVSFTFLKPVLIINVFSTIFIAVSEVYSYELIVIGKPWQAFYSRILRDSAILLVCMFLFIYTQFQESLIAVVISLFFNIIYLGILFLYYRRNQYVREE